jgi:hypothetical protein
MAGLQSLIVSLSLLEVRDRGRISLKSFEKGAGSVVCARSDRQPARKSSTLSCIFSFMRALLSCPRLHNAAAIGAAVVESDVVLTVVAESGLRWSGRMLVDANQSEAKE